MELTIEQQIRIKEISLNLAIEIYGKYNLGSIISIKDTPNDDNKFLFEKMIETFKTTSIPNVVDNRPDIETIEPIKLILTIANSIFNWFYTKNS